MSQGKSSIEHNGDGKSFHVIFFFCHLIRIKHFSCSWLGAGDSRTASYMAKVFKCVPCLLILLEKWLWLLINDSEPYFLLYKVWTIMILHRIVVRIRLDHL